MRVAGLLLLLAAACGAPPDERVDVLPDAIRHPGPVHAFRDQHFCSYDYDDTGHLIRLEFESDDRNDPLDGIASYQWNGAELTEIAIHYTVDSVPVRTLVWANEAEGSVAIDSYLDELGQVLSSTIDTMTAPVALPAVLVCDLLKSAEVYMASPNAPYHLGFPDRLLTRTYESDQELTRTEIEYTGVAAGQPGTRVLHFEDRPLPDGPLQQSFDYDQQGRLVGQSYFDDESSTTEHTYHDDGRFAENRRSHDDVLYISTYSYDAAGNLLEISTTSGDENDIPPPETIETYEYQ